MNNKLNISNRLKAIGDFVNYNDLVVDVGCDHALLSIYIYLNKTKKVIASDINSNPLKEAAKNLEKYNLKNKIELRLSNGLEKFSGNEFNTIIISGMGGLTIVDILDKSRNKLFNTKKMIIQSNKDVPLIRKYITNLGFKITYEILVKENKIIYTIILFEKSSKKIKYNKTDILLGPILKNGKDLLFKELLNNEFEKKKKILNNIPKKYIIKKINLKKEIKIYKELLYF